MGFDDEVDSARERLERARADDEKPIFDDIGALHGLLPVLAEKIASRRLSFALVADDDENVIEVTHIPSRDALGYVYAEAGEYLFESNHDEYFEDFVDGDLESFVSRLYELLRADLPKYEVEQEE